MLTIQFSPDSSIGQFSPSPMVRPLEGAVAQLAKASIPKLLDTCGLVPTQDHTVSYFHRSLLSCQIEGENDQKIHSKWEGDIYFSGVGVNLQATRPDVSVY